MELAGVGALLKLLEERRKRLAAEGLFEAERKKKLPFLPAVIGVVTSPTGAVIRDILHRLADRFPRRVLLWPVAVQGEGAAAQVAAAIAGFNRLRAGRRGAAARPDHRRARRRQPRGSDGVQRGDRGARRGGIGDPADLRRRPRDRHDADRLTPATARAPTPTAAAEMAVPVRLDLSPSSTARRPRLIGRLTRLFAERAASSAGGARPARPAPPDRRGDAAPRRPRRAAAPGCGAPLASGAAQPRSRSSAIAACGAVGHLDRSRARVAEVEPRLRAAMARFIDRNRHGLDNFAGRLATHSERHESLLARGYVVVRNSVARVLTGAAEISAGDPLDLEFHDSRVGVVAGSRPRPRPRRTGAAPGQGSLF